MISVCVLSFCVNLVSVNHAFYELELKYGALEYKSNETAHKFESLDNSLEYNGKVAVELAIHNVISNAAHEASKFGTALVQEAKSEGKDGAACYEDFQKLVTLGATDSVDLVEPCLTKIEQKYRDLSNHLQIEKMNGHELASIVHGLPQACSEFGEQGEYECFKKQLDIYVEKQYYLGVRYNELQKEYESTVAVANEAVQCIKDKAVDINSIVDDSVALLADCLQSQ